MFSSGLKIWESLILPLLLQSLLLQRWVVCEVSGILLSPQYSGCCEWVICNPSSTQIPVLSSFQSIAPVSASVSAHSCASQLQHEIELILVSFLATHRIWKGAVFSLQQLAKIKSSHRGNGTVCRLKKILVIWFTFSSCLEATTTKINVIIFNRGFSSVDADAGWEKLPTFHRTNGIFFETCVEYLFLGLVISHMSLS